MSNRYESRNNISSNRQYIEKCDGCFERAAVYICTVCDKSYCKACGDQIHSVPSYSHHEK
jgi:rRNA maturation endonuclease Nob1